MTIKGQKLQWRIGKKKDIFDTGSGAGRRVVYIGPDTVPWALNDRDRIFKFKLDGNKRRKQV